MTGSQASGDGAAIELELAPRAENAAVARHAVAELGQRAGLGHETVCSAQVVVTEAFTNAANHGSVDGGETPIRVLARAIGDRLEIAVRDRGPGFRPRPVGPHGSGRLGLLLIAAVADCVKLSRLPEGGTEVSASVSAAGARRARGAPCCG